MIPSERWFVSRTQPTGICKTYARFAPLSARHDDLMLHSERCAARDASHGCSRDWRRAAGLRAAADSRVRLAPPTVLAGAPAPRDVSRGRLASRATIAVRRSPSRSCGTRCAPSSTRQERTVPSREVFAVIGTRDSVLRRVRSGIARLGAVAAAGRQHALGHGVADEGRRYDDRDDAAVRGWQGGSRRPGPTVRQGIPRARTRSVSPLRHLLTHSSGLPAWRPLYKETDSPPQPAPSR